MEYEFKESAERMRKHVVRLAWTTTQQRWTTSFALGGLLLATILMPSFGIAAFGTAIAGWWIAVFFVAVFSGLVGNRIGIGKEKAEMMQQNQPPKDL